MEGERKNAALLKKDGNDASHYQPGNEATRDKDNGKRADMEDDIRLLLDCLRFQRHCPASQRQALSTMATMCAHSSESRDLFRVTGALSYVVELLYSTSAQDVQQAALYALGCAAEKNVVNQMKICDDRLLSFLADMLKPNTPTMSTPMTPALIMSIAYVCGCLMSGNAQGQNTARERRLLHRLIAIYKSYLPKVSHSTAAVSQKEGAGEVGGITQNIQVWTSISSALCTANNNPQNEMNQCVCSQLLPAALSLVGESPLSPDVMRPAIGLITSCVANNGTTQGRLRMIGGLQILVFALKELSNDQQGKQLTKRVLLTDLAVHIVQALSASILANATSTDTLCHCGAIANLLQILQWEGLDGHAQLSIVMCLSMLTEDRVSTQQELIAGGGVQLLLSILSGSCEEELSKAITFVLQCCLSQQAPMNNSGDDVLRAGIARVEKLLAQNNDSSSSTVTGQEEGDAHNLSTESSQSQDHSITSAAALRPHAVLNCKPSTQKLPYIFDHLDRERLPVKTAIANWLIDTDCKVQGTPADSLGHKRNDVMVGGVINRSTRLKHDLVATQEVSQRVKGQIDDDKIVDTDCKQVKDGTGDENDKSNNDRGKVEGGDKNLAGKNTLLAERKLQKELKKKCEQENVEKKRIENKEKCNDKITELDVLARERRLRRELEQKLEKESMKRKKLEKLVKQVKLAQHNKQGKEDQTLVINQENRHVGKQEAKLPHKTEGSGRGICKVVSASQPGRETNFSDNKENIPPKVLQVAASASHSDAPLSNTDTNTPVNKPASCNIRYATSSNMYKTKRRLHQGGLRAPSTCLNVSAAKLEQRENRDLERSCVREQSNGDRDLSKHEQCSVRLKKDWKSRSDARQHELSTIYERGAQHYPPVISQGRNAELGRNHVTSQSVDQCLDHGQVGVSLGGRGMATKDVVLPSQHSSRHSSNNGRGCEHHCLACRPRLRCTTVTSRNFIQMIRIDRFSCAYHKSLIQSLSSATNTATVQAKQAFNKERTEKTSDKSGQFNHTVAQPSKYGQEMAKSCRDSESKAGKSKPKMVTQKGGFIGKQLSIGGGGGEVTSERMRIDGEGKGEERYLSSKRDRERALIGHLPRCDGSRVTEVLKDSSNVSVKQHKERICSHGDRGLHHRDNDGEDPSNYDSSSIPECGEYYSADSASSIVNTQTHDSNETIHLDSEEESELSLSCSSDPSWTLSSSHTSTLASSTCSEDNNKTVVKVKNELSKEKLPSGDVKGVSGSNSGRGNMCSSDVVTISDVITLSQQSQSHHRPQYNLVARPKMNKKTERNYGALRDLTNRDRTIVGGAKGQAKKTHPSSALTVFDYTTPDKVSKPVSSKYRSSATGEVHPVSQPRRRVPWSKTEEENLMRGVSRLGHQWRHILSAYEFHHSRDAVSLKDKYRNLRKHIKP